MRLITIIILICWHLFAYSQNPDLKFIEKGDDLLLIDKSEKYLLKDVIIPELSPVISDCNAYNSFIITYEFFASTVKYRISYFFVLKKDKTIIVNKIVHFNYDDRKGVPFGWIILCNNKFLIDELNYDVLSNISSYINYSEMERSKTNSSFVCSTKEGLKIKTINSINSSGQTKFQIPVFYETDTYIGSAHMLLNIVDWCDFVLEFTPIGIGYNYFPLIKV